MADVVSIREGVYSNAAGHVCRVVGLAYYPSQNKNIVAYVADYGKPDGRLLVEDVGEFMASLKRGEYEYHGVKYKRPRLRSLKSPARVIRPGTLHDIKA